MTTHVCSAMKCKILHYRTSIASSCLLSAIAVLLLIDATEAGSRVSVSLPDRVRSGEDVTLSCKYDGKSSSKMYKVRWLFNNQEFYRYEKRDRSQNFYTTIPGVHVNLLASDGERVVLKNVSHLSGGLYRCEVTTGDSTEAIVGEGVMTVVKDSWFSSSSSSALPSIHRKCSSFSLSLYTLKYLTSLITILMFTR